MDFGKLTIDELNANNKDTLMGALGIVYTMVTPTRVEGTMLVCAKTRQPFGILHGGATLALAETLAGVASYQHCPENYASLGMQVSCNHVSCAREGETVTGIATPVQLGHSTHVWNIDVKGADGRLISTIRIVNAIRPVKA